MESLPMKYILSQLQKLGLQPESHLEAIRMLNAVTGESRKGRRYKAKRFAVKSRNVDIRIPKRNLIVTRVVLE